jgi:hypothetical protein
MTVLFISEPQIGFSRDLPRLQDKEFPARADRLQIASAES